MGRFLRLRCENYFAMVLQHERKQPDGKCQILYSKAKSMEGPWSVRGKITWADGSSIDTTDPGVMWIWRPGRLVRHQRRYLSDGWRAINY